MIKGMTVVESVLDGGDFARLKELFASLGFETGKGWKDATGQGAAFLAPLGNLEFFVKLIRTAQALMPKSRGGSA